MKLEIHPALHLEILTLPGSARIQCRVDSTIRCMFDPVDRTWHPYPPHATADFLSRFSEDDLARIEQRLLRHSEQRRAAFAALNQGPPAFPRAVSPT